MFRPGVAGQAPWVAIPGLKAIGMWWLDDIVVPVLLLLGFSCFAILVGFRTRMLTRRTTRRAEDLYPQYADSARKQRRYAREHGGQWPDDGSPQGKAP